MLRVNSCGTIPDRQAALIKGIVELVIANRSSLYHLPAPGEMSFNGGSKINDKTQQILRKMVAANGVSLGDVVGEAVGKGKGKARSTPTKPKVEGEGARGASGSPSKKRKVKEKAGDNKGVESE